MKVDSGLPSTWAIPSVMPWRRPLDIVCGTEKRSQSASSLKLTSPSGVSGGSFPAAYYGLYGDRIFQEFEQRFLRKNVQGALVLRALRPWNLLGLMTPWLSRSDLASNYYHKRVFDEATFADLTAYQGTAEQYDDMTMLVVEVR